jgi:hypothetical protein
MTQAPRFTAALLACSAMVLIGSGLMVPVHAEKQLPASTSATSPAILSGKVTDVRNAMGYTYAEVDTGLKKVWVAGPLTELKAGDTVSFSTLMPMRNFHSKSLDRDFDVLYFIDAFTNEKGEPLETAGQRDMSDKKPVMDKDPAAAIDKLDGGQTIAEIHEKREALKDQTVRVRGEVTRFNSGIMGKNWLHIRDSSTSDDLTATTQSMVATGDIVIVEGTLQLDQDFGYGYVYPLIVEDAIITKE